MTHKLYIGTNTKMFQTGNEAEAYIRRMDELIDDIRDRLEFFFIPSYTSLERTAKAVGDRIRIGAQNMAWEDRGQFTGEVSPLMLEEIGVIMGFLWMAAAVMILFRKSIRIVLFTSTVDTIKRFSRCY